MTLAENPPEFVPTCKVCERGQLAQKKIFRMSGPVVVIGFILLIPSIMGIAVCAILLAVTAIYTNPQATINQETNKQEISREGFDNSFRGSCIKSWMASASPKINGLIDGESAYTAWMNAGMGYCECALTQYKATQSSDTAESICVKEYSEAKTPTIDQATQQLYYALMFEKADESPIPKCKLVSWSRQNHWNGHRGYLWRELFRQWPFGMASRDEKACTSMLCLQGHDKRLLGLSYQKRC